MTYNPLYNISSDWEPGPIDYEKSIEIYKPKDFKEESQLMKRNGYTLGIMSRSIEMYTKRPF